MEHKDNLQPKVIIGEIFDIISSLLNQTNTHKQTKFIKKDFNNYKINDKPFEVYYDRIKYDKEFRISPSFFKIFHKGDTLYSSNFTHQEYDALYFFVDYAGGLERDRRSNLYKILKSFRQSNIQETDGDGTNFILLSSVSNVLDERFEVLVGESLTGKSNAFREASGVLQEL